MNALTATATWWAPAGRDSALPAAVERRRGLPSPLSTTSPTHPHCTPVPTPAHPTPRAIRVRRSPR
ncbi:hypothetical protein SALBM311S_04762 [Streptomyces alboniger]